jgi:atrial natriuretic peptide receptor A
VLYILITLFVILCYCNKDLLENQQIELESSFKHHLIHDIIKGMLFISSSDIKCHGNLTSANCVVDSRFTLKITDFGLSTLYNPKYTNEESFYKSILVFTNSKMLIFNVIFDTILACLNKTVKRKIT